MLVVTFRSVLWATAPGKMLLELNTFQVLDVISCSVCSLPKVFPKEVRASIRKLAFSEGLEVTIQMFHDLYLPLYRNVSSCIPQVGLAIPQCCLDCVIANLSYHLHLLL